MNKIPFWLSFGKSFIFIFLSEIGDETFLTILLYTSKLKTSYLLITSLLALFIMNFIAIFLGRFAPDCSFVVFCKLIKSVCYLCNFLKKIVEIVSTVFFCNMFCCFCL